MSYINTGQARAENITIETLVDGVVTATETYWITQDLPSGFAFRYGGAPVSVTDLQRFPDGAIGSAGTYLDMLDQFQTAVEALFTGLDIGAVQSNDPYINSYPPCVIA